MAKIYKDQLIGIKFSLFVDNLIIFVKKPRNLTKYIKNTLVPKCVGH